MPIVPFARVRLAAAPAGGVAAPRWQKLFPLGVTKHRADFPGGKIEFTASFLQSLAANYAAEGKPERAVNYFHRGSSDGDRTAIEDKVAAGWISDLAFEPAGDSGDRADGPGLYALISWTERARRHIESDELRYLSPEFATNATSKATGRPQGPTLFGAALLNDPFLTELPAVAAAEKPRTAMDRKLICAALGLPEDATDEQINAKAVALCNPAEKQAMAERIAKLAASEAAVVKLTAENAALAAEVSALRSATKTAEVKNFFDRMVSEGRVVPATREGLEKIALAAGLDAVKFLEQAPVIVPMKTESGTSSAGGADVQAQWDAKLTEFEKAGMSPLAAFEATKRALPELWIKLGVLPGSPKSEEVE